MFPDERDHIDSLEENFKIIAEKIDEFIQGFSEVFWADTSCNEMCRHSLVREINDGHVHVHLNYMKNVQNL